MGGSYSHVTSIQREETFTHTSAIIHTHSNKLTDIHSLPHGHAHINTLSLSLIHAHSPD